MLAFVHCRHRAAYSTEPPGISGAHHMKVGWWALPPWPLRSISRSQPWVSDPRVAPLAVPLGSSRSSGRDLQGKGWRWPTIAAPGWSQSPFLWARSSLQLKEQALVPRPSACPLGSGAGRVACWYGWQSPGMCQANESAISGLLEAPCQYFHCHSLLQMLLLKARATVYREMGNEVKQTRFLRPFNLKCLTLWV